MTGEGPRHRWPLCCGYVWCSHYTYYMCVCVSLFVVCCHVSCFLPWCVVKYNNVMSFLLFWCRHCVSQVCHCLLVLMFVLQCPVSGVLVATCYPLVIVCRQVSCGVDIGVLLIAVCSLRCLARMLDHVFGVVVVCIIASCLTCLLLSVLMFSGIIYCPLGIGLRRLRPATAKVKIGWVVDLICSKV